MTGRSLPILDFGGVLTERDQSLILTFKADKVA